MKNGLELKHLWHDGDVFELRASASNGRFSGESKPYVGIGDLAAKAAILEGFPSDVEDVRELEFGAFGQEFAGGGLHLRFFCADGAGHAAVEVRIEDKFQRDGQHLPAQKVNFLGFIEASAVDEFVMELRQLEEKKSGSALLRFHEPNL
jgi:hypothetical protein